MITIDEKQRDNAIQRIVDDDDGPVDTATAIYEAGYMDAIKYIASDIVNNDTANRMFDIVQEVIYETAVEHGFWTDKDKRVKLLLIISEAVEAFEAIRNNEGASEHIPEHSAYMEELADVVIRCFDLAAHEQQSLGATVLAKMTYNKGRPYLHGKNF